MANSRSASTLVLTNSDLLHCIFTFVSAPESEDPTGEDDLSHSSLARCTTVCRAFHEPAIRLLWRTLGSLFPLWQLLAPPNARYPDSKPRGDKLSDYLQKVVSARLYDDPSVLDRFLWHAARVRRVALITYCASPETNTAQSLLILGVSLKNGGKTFLPLLHSIQWKEEGPSDSSLTQLFTPTLRDATFSFESFAEEITQVLLIRRLHECAPYLEKIDIHTPYWDDETVDHLEPQLVQELLSFDRLCEVKIHHFSQLAAFRDLAAKPNLTSLTVSHVTVSSVGSPPSTLVHALRKLSVTGTDRALTALFNHIHFPALESATLEVRISHAPVDETTTVLTAFANAVPNHCLRSLDLYIFGSGSWSIDPALRNLVGPILRLRGLHDFRFDTEDLAPRIGDADIEALAGAWPELEHLSLDSASSSNCSALSINSLYGIHAHCRNLNTLEVGKICCPAVGVHPIPTPLGGRPSPHPLQHLVVNGRVVPAFGRGRVGDEAAEALARYLLELFPAVNSERSAGAGAPHWQSTCSAYQRIFMQSS